MKQQRWSANRKAEIVLQILKNESNIVDLCRKHNLKQSELQAWVDDFLQGGTQSLKVHAKHVQHAHRKEVRDLRSKVGELVMELEARKKWEAMQENQEESNY